MHTAAIPRSQQPVMTYRDLPAPTHPVLVGYLFWIIGFTGAHRFYFGKPLTGALWFLTGGLFLIGWIVDFFFIPSMADEANRRYRPGRIDHTVTRWLEISSHQRAGSRRAAGSGKTTVPPAPRTPNRS